MTRIIDGVMTTSNLCTECSEASPSVHDRETAEWLREITVTAQTAHCKYCGDQPCVPSPDFTASLAGERRCNFMCVPCWTEFTQMMKQKLPSIQEELPNAKQSMSRMKEIVDKFQMLQDVADKHMKQWVSQRGGH